jgi:hypothetical protein
MSIDELHNKAWRLISAAKVASRPERRRMLMSEAFDLIREAKAIAVLAQSENKAAPRHPYRVWFSRPDGATLWVELEIESRADALWAADALAAACSEEYQEFGLWHGPTCLFTADTRYSHFSPQSAVEVTLASQRAVLEAEELLQSSNTVLARSRKLLEATADMRKSLEGSSIN